MSADFMGGEYSTRSGQLEVRMRLRWVHPGPPARGQPCSRGNAIGVSSVLPSDVHTRRRQVTSRQGLQIVSARPLENMASILVDSTRRFGLGMPNERSEGTIRPEARNDVHVIG